DTSRVGAKKPQSAILTLEQATALKNDHPDTLVGYRDSLILCLLLDHGLRVGEVAGLQVSELNLDSATFTFYRSKVDLVQTHRMTPDTLVAAEKWLAGINFPLEGPLIRAMLKGNKVSERGITVRAIAALVRKHGTAIGVPQLSPHDCRHYWATRAVAQGTDTFALRDAGGWKSIAMPARYVEASRIANERVKL
ncbi:MAG TPA: site-specific integrase, partial [Caldilineaceae bacterium]|nr:site-specific integrase [Caldilineaceae bacterium]